MLDEILKHLSLKLLETQRDYLEEINVVKFSNTSDSLRGLSLPFSFSFLFRIRTYSTDIVNEV